MNDYQRLVTQLLKRADIEVNGSRDSDIQVHDESFFRRFLKDGRVGLGDSYVEGQWDCNDLSQMFYKLTRSKVVTAKDKRNLSFMKTILKAKLLPAGNIKRSHLIGQKHYDIGNNLYQKMLDPRLVYTCGYFLDETELDKAQEAKLELICKKLKLKPGMSILDIGCGWGSFAKYAAEKYDVSVTGVTISQEQINLGKKLCEGLNVDLKYQDYREVEGQFDRIVSIGMFEHVGKNYYETFFKKANTLLKDDGIFLLHTIGTNESEWSNEWLTKYIFPGGYLPSLKHVSAASEGSFVLEDFQNFGPSYDKTLNKWFENFNSNWDSIKVDYDEHFYRMWKYYLLSSAGGFRSRFAQLWHFTLTKKGLVGGYHYEGNYKV